MKLQDDDFTLFGLPKRMSLDRADLDHQWRALQAAAHPDRFVGEGAAAQRLAMQWAVRINEAYARLKDPLKRAAYLCELHGVGIDATSNTAMPPSFLMKQMAWREALDEAALVGAIVQLDQEVADEESCMLGRLRQTLDEQGDVEAAAAQVRALMFVARFREDIQRRLEALEA